ncbi:hypothetical protein CFB50_31740 [Burkholderia sp. AU33423]|nr:hypothetical protein CFB50_31740 [Burkholderia sp. AU33423]
MLIGPDGRVASLHYEPPSLPLPPPPTAAAAGAATAKAGLQAQLGDQPPSNGASLADALRKLREKDAASAADALARAAILLQAQYDAIHHRATSPGVDPIGEAESEVGLTHQFDQDTLDAAARSLSNGALPTASAVPSSTAPAVSLVDARGAIQAGLNDGLTWSEAVNAARVQFGGSTQNETVLDEAALTIQGDALAHGADASQGDVLGDAARQVASLHLFDDAHQRAALAALKTTAAPSPALASDATRADTIWTSLQHDTAAHAAPAQIAADWRAYHTALSTELDDAAGRPAAGTTGTADWATDPSQRNRRWFAERAVLAANTAAGMHGPAAGDLSTALDASEVLDAMEAAPASANANGAANLKAAQVLTQQLAGVSPTDALYQQVMSDPRTAVLENAAFGDITGVQGAGAQATLTAEGTALSGYRGTVLFPALLHDTLASDTTQHTLRAVGVPDNLQGIANLLDPLAQASPELAQALFTQMQGKIDGLIRQGPDVIQHIDASRGDDTYYGPLARIIDDAGGPRNAATRPEVDALRTQLQQQQTQLDEGGTEALSNPFQSLTFLHDPQHNRSTAVYQALIDEAPTSELAGTLEKYTGLKPSSTAATVSVRPADASALAQAQAALDAQLGGGPVNAQTLQKALDAARAATDRNGALANAAIGDTTWAQAAIVEQARADSQTNADGNANGPQDPIERAAGELSGDQLFDANTLVTAADALRGGTLADGSTLATQQQIPSLMDGGRAADYMQRLVNDGMTMREAIVLTRAWLGGTPASESTLVQAALTVRAGQQDIMQQYLGDPSQDPMKLAAQQLDAMKQAPDGSAPGPANVLDPALIARTVDGTPASDGRPAVPGWAQDIKPDLAALNGKDGLIAQAQHAYDAWQRAQAGAAANPQDGHARDAASTALTQYHAALSAALDAAAGRAPNDSGWQSDPAYVDTLWKAQIALAQQIQAAPGQDAPADGAVLQQWQRGLDALQIIGRVQAAQRLATPPGADPSAGNVSAAQTLTAETAGLQQADPGLYQQVMGDAFVGNLGKAALASIAGAAAPPWVCPANGDAGADVNARLHAAGSLLQQYQSTVIYAQLKDAVAGDPAMQQLFATIEDEVRSRKRDADKLGLLADLVQGSGSTDLSAQLVHQMFGAGGTQPVFSPEQLVAWTRNANDPTQVSRIYWWAGGAQNQDMTDLRHALETMVTRDDPTFGGESRDSKLNPQHRVISKGGSVVWGEDLGFGGLRKHDQPMQLARDMLGDDAMDPLGKEIARETGYQDTGKPAAGVSVSAPGQSALPTDAAYVPGAGPAVSTGGGLVGLPLPDGMQTLGSDAALLNAAGSAYGVTVARMPTTLAQEQALSDGTFALYDPNETVFDASGHKTTLGQAVDNLKQGEGVRTPSGLAPVTLASLAGEWWNSRRPSQDQKGTPFTLLEGLSANGGLVDVGPADPTARHGYADWQSHTGFAKGFMIAQPHWVVNAQGQDLTDAAYFVDYKPDMGWWERWGADLQIAGTAAAGVLALAAAPETAPLWFALMSEAADAYLTWSATVGTVNAAKQLSTARGRGDWVNWLGLAANLSGGAASGFGTVARAATIGDRLASGASAYADVARVTTVARGTNAQQFANVQALAAVNGMRAVTTFDDTLPAQWLTRATTATEGRMQGTAAFAEIMQAWQGSTTSRLLGGAAMVTNGTAMAQQAAVLTHAALAGKPVTAQDWLSLASSAGLTALGFGVARANGVDDSDAPLRAYHPADSWITARPGTAIPPTRSYTVPDATRRNPVELANVLSNVLGSQGSIDHATYVVLARDSENPAQSGLTLVSLPPGTLPGLGQPLTSQSLFDARTFGNATSTHGIAIVDERGIAADGTVPPAAVIGTIKAGRPLEYPIEIEVNGGYTKPIRFTYKHSGRATTWPAIEIDEKTGGWVVHDAVRQNGDLMDAFISALASSGGRLAGTRYVAIGTKGGSDPVNPAVAIVDDSGRVVATLRLGAAENPTGMDSTANGWRADFMRDYAGSVSVMYPAGFDMNEPLIRNWNGQLVDVINARAGGGRTQLPSYPPREADLAVYINAFDSYPENRLLGVDESGRRNPLLLPVPPGYFGVDQHAGPKGFLNSVGNVLTPEQEAALIIGAGWDGKKPILFYSCGPGAQFTRSDGRQMEAPLIQQVTDALQRLYPLMRGKSVDPGFHTIAANRPVAWYVQSDDGYTSDVRVPITQEWSAYPELASWMQQRDSIVNSEEPGFSYYYPGAQSPD